MQNPHDEPNYQDNAEAHNSRQVTELQSDYPVKPLPGDTPKGNPILKFIISALLFGGFYYFFVSKNLELIIWLAIIVFIHELGHYFAMKLFRYQDLSIFFIPLLGAMAGGSKEKISQKEKGIVLLAGPVPGIIIGVIIFLIAGDTGNYSLSRLSYAFVLINALNLLPIYPLDGGQLLKTLFLGSREIVSTIFVVCSIVLMAAYAVYNREWFLLIIPYFFVVRMLQQRQVTKIRSRLRQEQINYSQSYSELSDKDYWRIRGAVLTLHPVLARTVGANDYVISDRENDIINYVKSVLKTQPVKDLTVTGIIIFMLIWIASFGVPLLLMGK